MSKKKSLAIVVLCLIIAVTAGVCYVYISEEDSYGVLFQYDNAHYTWDYSYTCKKPNTEIGQILSFVKKGKLPKVNNQVNEVNYQDKKLYRIKGDSESIYIKTNGWDRQENVPVYDKFTKANGKDDIMQQNEECQYLAIKFADKLFVHNSATHSFINVNKKDLTEVGVIETWYAGKPEENFSTNYQGVLGTVLYQSNIDKNIVYSIYVSGEGKKRTNCYIEYVYEPDITNLE